MSEATTRSGNPAKRAAAKKAVAVKKTVTPKQAQQSKVMIIEVDVLGEKYQMRASKYLMIKVMDQLGEMSMLAEAEDDDERELDPTEIRVVADSMKQVIALFDRKDAGSGLDSGPSSQERIFTKLEDGEIDFDDLTDAFNQMASQVRGPGGRPLG